MNGVGGTALHRPRSQPTSNNNNSRGLNTDNPLTFRNDASHFQKCTARTRTIAHYRRIEQIGEGTYGQVYKAISHDNQIVALKKIRLTSVASEGLPRTVIREIKILKALKHINMVRMIEVVSSKGYELLDEEDEHKEDKKKRLQTEKDGKDSSADALSSATHAMSNTNGNAIANEGNLFLVLEYVSHDLSGILDMGIRFTPVQSKCIFRQLLDVLQYMHEHRYVHRDLKSSNILIDSNWRVKLADFGLARMLDDDTLYSQEKPKYTNKVVTLWYRSPELLLGATDYDEKVDIWSAGCILAELLIGKALFPGTTDLEELKLIFKMMGAPNASTWDGLMDYPKLKSKEIELSTVTESIKGEFRDKYSNDDRIGTSALALIERMLELDPKKRWRAQKALESSYFRSKPLAPMNPQELGPMPVMGDSHEFQTKPIRKMAKVYAQKASKRAKTMGENEKEAYDSAYTDYLKKASEARSRGLELDEDGNEKKPAPPPPKKSPTPKRDHATMMEESDVPSRRKDEKRREESDRHSTTTSPDKSSYKEGDNDVKFTTTSRSSLDRKSRHGSRSRSRGRDEHSRQERRRDKDHKDRDETDRSRRKDKGLDGPKISSREHQHDKRNGHASDDHRRRHDKKHQSSKDDYHYVHMDVDDEYGRYRHHHRSDHHRHDREKDRDRHGHDPHRRHNHHRESSMDRYHHDRDRRGREEEENERHRFSSSMRMGDRGGVNVGDGSGPYGPPRDYGPPFPPPRERGGGGGGGGPPRIMNSNSRNISRQGPPYHPAPPPGWRPPHSNNRYRNDRREDLSRRR